MIKIMLIFPQCKSLLAVAICMVHFSCFFTSYSRQSLLFIRVQMRMFGSPPREGKQMHTVFLVDVHRMTARNNKSRVCQPSSGYTTLRRCISLKTCPKEKPLLTFRLVLQCWGFHPSMACYINSLLLRCSLKVY